MNTNKLAAPSLVRRLVQNIRTLLDFSRGDTTQRSARVEADWEFLKEAWAAAGANRKQPQLKSPPAIADFKNVSGGKGYAVDADIRETVPAQLHGARPLNIVFITYGPYDNNSAIHVTGFANTLTAFGHKVVVSAMGSSSKAGDIGLPRFRCIPHQQLADTPEIVEHYFAGSGGGTPDIIHCWTPRQAVRTVAQAVISRYGCPYVVHFEDNEVAVAQSFGGISEVKAASMVVDTAHSMQEFIFGASGATIIVDALQSVLPNGLPFQLLEPGVDTTLFKPGLGAAERKRICDALGVPSDAWITVYAGNIHSANADDMFSLYAAIHVLNARKFKVHLIRTGIDSLPSVDPVFSALTERYVTNLGFVRREWVLELLKLADFFVQPGGPDEFNTFRLPSKIPEFLAMGRPLVLPRTNIGLLLKHRVHALLMERGDAAEIAECVEALLTDPAFAAEIGQEGRRFATEHFNWVRSAKQLEGFLRQILRG